MEIGFSGVGDPSNHHVRAWHLPVWREAQADPSSRAHVHREIDALRAGLEVPVEAVVLAVLVEEHHVEGVPLRADMRSSSQAEQQREDDQSFCRHPHNELDT